MALQATYISPNIITVTATAVDIGLGIRVTLDSSGTVAASAIDVRGDFMTLQTIPASGVGEGIPLQSGVYVPALASEACAVGDPAYSAADGKTSKTSGGGAVLIGKWNTAAASGAIGQVLLGNPA